MLCSRVYDRSTNLRCLKVSPTLKGPHYWNTLEEKQELRDEFMIK
jgi:hypothetical protein